MIRIIMMDPPSYMPLHMADFDGFYSLDLNKNERIALTRVIDDYADVGKIKQDTFKDLTLPPSKKNKLLLGAVGNPSALNVDHNKIFDIQLLKTDFSYPVQGLQIVGVTDVDGGGFLATIFGELNDWYRPMSQLRLSALDLGIDVVDFNWYTLNAFKPKYEDGDYAVFTNVVNYGKWFIESNISPFQAQSQVVFNDLRLWYSPLALLRAAFCQVGYELISPNLEEEEFRHQWCYLLDPNFETANQADILNRPFEIERISGQISLAVLFENSSNGKDFIGVLFWTALDPATDPGSHLIFNNDFVVPYPPTTRYFGCFYSGGVIGNFKYTGTSRLILDSGSFTTIAPDFVTITFTIRKSLKFGMEDQADMLANSKILASQTVVLKGVFLGGTPVDTDFNIETGFVKVYQHEIVFVFMEFKASLRDNVGNLKNEINFHSNSIIVNPVFSMEAQTQIIEEGDTIDFGLMLRKDISPIDLFRGVAHLNGLKVETDTINKRVYAFPEFRYNWYRSGLQKGFFKENTDSPFDATLKIQANSMAEESLISNLGRNAYLKFKDSTDGFIQNQALTEQELHSKKIDLGAKFSNGENKIENPFFEPTDVGIDNQISGLSVNVFSQEVLSANMIPFLWEGSPNDDVYPNRGYDFAPRILIAYQGVVILEPSITGQQFDTTVSYIYEDSVGLVGTLNLFGQIFQEGVKFTITSPQPTPDMANVYGNGRNPLIKDQFTLFYSRMIQQAYFGVVLNFLVKLDLVDFSNISFRRKWKVRYLSPWGEIFFYARLSRVDDYVIGENITTPVQLISDSNNTNLGC